MGRKGQLTVRVIGDTKPVEKSLDSLTGVFKGFAAGALGILGGIGLAGGALLAKEFGDALGRDKLGDRLAAQLNLTGPAAERAGEIAGDLYADAYGDSLAQVHDAVGAVMSSLGDLDDGEVEDLTAKTLDLASAFDVDVNEAVSVAGVAMRQGLARDGDHAFDLIVRSMQSVPQAMRHELLPVIEEYGQDFAALGITGQDAFGLLVEAAQDGRFELDKTGDALKELTVRSTDMSAASVAAYEALGLSAGEMANDILAGGKTARGALDTIVGGLLSVEDPAERANLAIALMGTPLEDLSVAEIPAFLQRLADMDTSLGNVEGAAVEMGNKLNDNVATKIEAFKRKAGKAIEDWAYVNVLPAAEEVLAAFEKDGVGGALDKAQELWEESWPDLKGWLEQTVLPGMADLGREAGLAFAKGMMMLVSEAIQFAWEQVKNLPGIIGSTIANADENLGNRPRPLGEDTVFHFGNEPPSPSGPTLGPGRPGGRFHAGGTVTGSLPRMPGDGPRERTVRARIGEEISPANIGRMAPRGGTISVTVNAPNYIGPKQDLARLVSEALREAQRRGGTLGFTA